MNFNVVVFAVALAALAIHLRDRGGHSPSPPAPAPVSAGVAVQSIRSAQADKRTLFRSAARRIRSGEIGSAKDLQTFLAFGARAVQRRANGPLDQYLGDEIGSRWIPTRAAEVCDGLASELTESRKVTREQCPSRK